MAEELGVHHEARLVPDHRAASERRTAELRVRFVLSRIPFSSLTAFSSSSSSSGSTATGEKDLAMTSALLRNVLATSA
ncbi:MULTISPECIES: hypothetical protein [Streptomyces]|uniref:Uncharacterized protein n=1 Tax=Streptomyces edwardsiae TaxID=3075527 RepID=A0ABU2PTT4_9ACTN|nr:hypothetical protein [Streptomyces sp. DSM 41636]MDT0395089.1 hypothetical protein [Streptomyces sp. DSM 41636]